MQDAGVSGRAGLTLEAGRALTPEQLSGLAITAADFDAAVARVQPSVRREGFATTPDVTWADVGSLAEVRRTGEPCQATAETVVPLSCVRGLWPLMTTAVHGVPELSGPVLLFFKKFTNLLDTRRMVGW